MPTSPSGPNEERNDDAEDAAPARGFSRRKILSGLAAGGVALGIPAVAVAQQVEPQDGRDREGREGRRNGRGTRGVESDDQETAARFSRMFDEGQSLQNVDDELRTMLAELGAPGGILDAKDPLEEGPIRLITEPELSANNQNNPAQTAGATFVGQFIDHDITRDAGSALGRRTSVRRSTNLRSARLDLDSVYGGGPSESPDLYRDDDPFTFRVESGGLFEDLPRDGEGRAIIADPRNDENLIVAGLQVAFLRFHNEVLAQVRSSGLTDQAAFDTARQTVVHHYQWLVLHQFLPQFVGRSMVDDILRNGRRYYRPTAATIP
ncbi:MAG: peroxidase family protein, partial [Acidimicrobiales bacterium]